MQYAGKSGELLDANQCRGGARVDDTTMQIIGKKLLDQFALRHSDALASLAHWSKVVNAARATQFSELKALFRSADYVRPYTVFNVGGNTVRVIAVVNYAAGRVSVRWVLTHSEYDKWSSSHRKGKV